MHITLTAGLQARTAELALEDPAQLLLDQWLELINDLSEKITRLDREIERAAVSHEEMQLLMLAPESVRSPG